MDAWWNNLEFVHAFNTWMEVITLAGAALSFICLLLLWWNGNHMVRHLIDRERRSNKRIKAVEKAAEQVRKELLSTQQNQDIADQQRRLAEMDADALRKEMAKVRTRYNQAEGALKDRIKELKEIHITQSTTQGSATTQTFGVDTAILDPQQRKMLTRLLKTGSKGELDIISVLDDSGSHQAATELKTIFDSQGWTTSDIIQSAFGHPQEGIILIIHSKQTAPSYAKFLQKTLTTAGLRVSAQINNKYREWSLSMIVGQIDST
ncbi:MAG: hypothetical protein PVI60_03065 [Desulfobacteraceae bacterium]|jgi:hypothetical protein